MINVNSVSVAPVLPKAPPAAAQAPPAAAAAAEQQRGRGLSADDAFLATLAKEDKAGGDCGSEAPTARTGRWAPATRTTLRE